jgi:hypothetical protein
VTVTGLTSGTRCWSLADLTQLPQVTRTIDVHCVTRWSRPVMEFRGVRLLELLESAAIPDTTRYVSFVAQSDRNHSTSLPLSVVRELDPLLVTYAEGKLLTTEHGGPLRVVVPGRYFYKSLKWVRRIELLTEDRLGYWESQAGYHNGANPWSEERFLAADLDLRTVRELVTTRDFRGRDLRGIAASGLDLQGLRATGAKLRDAHFEGADLQSACFDGANLSGAHLQRADLRGARFGPDATGAIADLEGADFRGADLRGATFQRASLFGATLGPTEDGHFTRIDETTIIDATSLATLEATPDQLRFFRDATVSPSG